MRKEIGALFLFLAYAGLGITVLAPELNNRNGLYHKTATWEEMKQVYEACAKRCKWKYDICIRDNNPDCTGLCCKGYENQCLKKCTGAKVRDHR